MLDTIEYTRLFRFQNVCISMSVVLFVFFQLFVGLHTDRKETEKTVVTHSLA